MRITEVSLPKNLWELVVSNADKQELGDNLIDLVNNAYGSTAHGSFVTSIKDVIPSDWNVIDWDADPDVDACVFYRGPRANEHWVGYKIQGIGHDGQKQSKDRVINKVTQLLNKPGFWIESSDAMRATLKRLPVPMVDSEHLLKFLFNDPNLKMVDHGTYQRKLHTGMAIETVFGNPRIT